jgi:large subunit ribosomal protein L20
MTRIKRGAVARQKRKKIIKLTKGFVGSNSKLFRISNQKYMKSLSYAYLNRRKKRESFKNLWLNRINIVSKLLNIKYKDLMQKIKKNNIILNKKVLCKLMSIDKMTTKKLINKINC